MKLKTTKTYVVELTSDEVRALLSKFIEKKSGKKVIDQSWDESGWKFDLAEESEETVLDEPKA